MKNPVYRNSVSADIRFAAIYKALSCLAVMSVFMPAVHAVFFGSLGIHPAFTVLTSALCFLLGYGLTEIYARVTGLKRRENDLSYEGLIRYFNAKAAALPIVVIVILSFPVFAFVSKYVRWRYENGLDMYWDPNSLWPLLGTALFIAVAVAGAVLWFYPYYRICSTKYFVWLLAFLLIDAFICRDQRFVVFCTFCYIALSLTVLNQNNLILSVIAADSATRGQSASDSDVAPDRLLGRVTVGMRMYNFGMVMILMLMLGIVLTACIATVVGIVTLGRMLLLFILAGIFRDPEEYVGEAEEAAEAAHKQIFAPEIYGMKSAAESESFFWLFILIAVLAGAFFIIAARTGLAQKILRFIQAVYEGIIRFFGALFRRRTEAPRSTPSGSSGYVDTEEEIDPAELRRLRGLESGQLTYRVFTREINSRRTVSEKFSYAYSVFAGLFSESGSGVKRSDTPRQIEKKLSERDDLGELGQITEMYERINYAVQTPPEDKAVRLTAGLSAVVRRMLGDK